MKPHALEYHLTLAAILAIVALTFLPFLAVYWLWLGLTRYTRR